MVNHTLEEVSAVEMCIKIEVPSDKVRSEIDRTYRTFSMQAKVQGFRQGKVPRRVLESRFKHQVENEAMQNLVSFSYDEALSSHPEIVPVGLPKVTNTNFKLGEPFSYHAYVEVKPKLDPQNYEGLSLQKSEASVSEEQVDKEIERLRIAWSYLEPITDRSVAEEGDFAEVSYAGTVDGDQFPGSQADSATVQVSSDGNILEGHVPLVGVSIGETREVVHTFSADHQPAQLANKTATFHVSLKALKTRILPPMDDQLAERAGVGSSLLELRNRIHREFMEAQNQKIAQETRKQLFQQLIERNSFEVPSALVEKRINQLLEASVEQFVRQGIDVRKLNLDVEQLRASIRPHAVADVKGALLVEAIADKESIAALPEDLDAKFKELSEKLSIPEDQVRQQVVNNQAMDAFRLQIREEKTLAFLKSKAKTE